MQLTSEREIVYVGDPMCSWCWGIAPELETLRRRRPDLGFRIVVGGLRPGPAAEPMTDRMAAALRHHWDQVAGRSGQRFDRAVLDRRDWTYDTEPACKAVVTVRTLDSDLGWPMFQRLQRAFYVEGRLLDDSETLTDLADEVGVEATAFRSAFETREAVKATWQDFSLARSWGVTGFPTVIAREGNRGSVIAAGYASASDMEMALAAAVPLPGTTCEPGHPC